MKTLNYNELLSILTYNLDQYNLQKRYFIALAGPPASGKSTISNKLNEDLNFKGYPSDILQMDGFHFDDAILSSKNLFQKRVNNVFCWPHLSTVIFISYINPTLLGALY